MQSALSINDNFAHSAVSVTGPHLPLINGGNKAMN